MYFYGSNPRHRGEGHHFNKFGKGPLGNEIQIKFKLHLLLFYPSTWHICDFFPFHIEIEGKGEWIIGGGGGGGGAKGMLAPPPKLLGGPGPPSSYAYDNC